MIRKVTMYETMGESFKTMRNAIAHRENLIEKFLRGLPGFEDMPAKSRIAFVSRMLECREHLGKLLDYHHVPSNDDDDTDL